MENLMALLESTTHAHRQKIVLAHYMVGNTYPYNYTNWKSNIKLASDSGIDGFALNVGKEDWQLDRVEDCFEACEEYRDFKLMISFDMSSFPSNLREDIHRLEKYVARFGHRQCYLKIDGRSVISTFAGESCFFGQADVRSGWKDVLERLNSVIPICFVPAFFLEPNQIKRLNADVLDGYFNWNGCWPVHLNPASPSEEVHMPDLDSDKHFQRHMEGKIYMASVSPWFFTHYGADSWNKNWIYHCDDWLYVRRWEQLVSLRDSVDIVQIISWNDYGESHYIGPIDGAQPNSQAWVDGFNHDAWQELTKYYASAFKTGIYPPIESDVIFAWTRPHPKDAIASKDDVPPPDFWQLTKDDFWVVVFATAPATVSLWSLDEPAINVSVSAGVSKLQCPLLDGGGLHVQMRRENFVTASLHPSDFSFTSKPEMYNFNVYVAKSS